MIPLKDTIPSRRFPMMTILLIIASVAIFIYQLRLTPESYNQVLRQFSIIPASYSSRLISVESLGPFITYIFLHGGWMHIIGNMWALWLFGDNVEDKMGPFRFLYFYLVTGIIAALVHIFTNPGSPVPTIGGSGAIAGVMGAYFVMYPGSKILTIIPIFLIPLFLEIPAVIYLGFWLISQVYSMLMSQGTRMVSNIAWSAHIGGFLAGALLHRLFFRRYRDSKYQF